MRIVRSLASNETKRNGRVGVAGVGGSSSCSYYRTSCQRGVGRKKEAPVFATTLVVTRRPSTRLEAPASMMLIAACLSWQGGAQARRLPEGRRRARSSPTSLAADQSRRRSLGEGPRRFARPSRRSASSLASLSSGSVPPVERCAGVGPCHWAFCSGRPPPLSPVVTWRHCCRAPAPAALDARTTQHDAHPAPAPPVRFGEAARRVPHSTPRRASVFRWLLAQEDSVADFLAGMSSIQGRPPGSSGPSTRRCELGLPKADPRAAEWL